MNAKRIDRMAELDEKSICYWRDDHDSFWWIYVPHCGIGNLSNHTVTEHEDLTITVSPSILLVGHDEGVAITKHGFLERGVWRDV